MPKDGDTAFQKDPASGFSQASRKFVIDPDAINRWIDDKDLAIAQGLGDTDHPDGINTLLMVGATPGDRNNSISDEIYFMALIDFCIRHNLPVNRSATAEVCNTENGMDFLTMSTPFDAVLFCYIYYNSRERNVRHNGQSPLAYKEGAWHDALQRTGAKLVGNIDDSKFELPTGLLAKAPYRLVGDEATPIATRRLHVLVRNDWAPAASLPAAMPHEGSAKSLAEVRAPRVGSAALRRRC